jgi:hypothetical protein
MRLPSPLLALAAAALPGWLSAQSVSSPGVVPGADVYVAFDLAAARKSPLFQELEKKDEKPEMRAKMKQATGLDKEDILRVVGTADIDALDFAGEPDPAQLAKMPAVLNVTLAKAVNKEQLKQGLTLISSEGQGAEMTFSDLAGGLVKGTPKDAEAGAQPMIAGLSADGKQVFIGANEQSVQDAVGRAAKPVELPAALAGIVAGPSQMQLAVVLPKVARDGITKAIDGMGADPGAVMMVGMLAPLKGLSKVALKGNFNPADLGLSFAADLSTPEFATQANMLLNTMVMPMAAQALGMDPAKPRIAIAAQGSVLTLKGSITKDELLKASAGLPGEATEVEGF